MRPHTQTSDPLHTRASCIILYARFILSALVAQAHKVCRAVSSLAQSQPRVYGALATYAAIVSTKCRGTASVTGGRGASAMDLGKRPLVVLVSVHKRLIIARAKLRRVETEWNGMLKQAEELESVKTSVVYIFCFFITMHSDFEFNEIRCNFIHDAR